MADKITWTNKDLISKILADRFGSKSLTMYGVNLPPIKEYLPTELPTIEATDRTIDRLFKLEDDSYLIVEFESATGKKNFLKYARYAIRVTDKLLETAENINLRILVIYTADVQSSRKEFSAGCFSLQVEQAFLSHIDGDTEYQKIKAKLDAGEELEDEELMRLIILPLTYKGEEKKQQMIDAVVEIASQIADDSNKKFVLAAIAVANDKFIRADQAERIRGMIRMTKVGELFERERIDYGNQQKQQRSEEIAKKMLAHGDDESYVMEVTGLTQERIDTILGRKMEEDVMA